MSIKKKDNQELLDIVDENDNVIGQDTKENKFSKGLISRTAVCFLKDGKNKLIIVKRSPTKKSFPNRYDLSVCGNVRSGETYEHAIKREINEELGIDCNVEVLEKIFNQFDENGKNLRYFTTVFLGSWNGDVHPNEESIELKRLGIKDIEEMVTKNKDQFTPGFVNDFTRLKTGLINKLDI